MTTNALVTVPSTAYPAAAVGTAGLVAAYLLAIAAGAVGPIVDLNSLGQATNGMQVNFTPQGGGTEDTAILLVSVDNFVTDIGIAKVMSAGDLSTQIPLIGRYVRVWRTGATATETGAAACSVSVIPASGSASGPAWIQGGNAFGALGVFGTTDAFGLSLISQGVQWATVGNTLAGRPVALLPGVGGLGLGVAPGGFGINLDTPFAGSIVLAHANAVTLVVGGVASSLSGFGIEVAPGGTIAIGNGISAGSTIDIATGASTYTVNIGAIGAGVKTINLGTAASINLISIGSSISELGFFGAAPVVQGAASADATVIVAGATAAHTETTYSGGVGGGAYSVGGIVLRLKQFGLLA